MENIPSTEEQISIVRNVMEESTFEEMPLFGNEIEKCRAFMKIQEGCNNFCSFCIIPYTRGKLKSRKIEDIVEEAKRLVAYGYKEVVLTGIHLGNYGIELPERPTLGRVVRELLTIDGLERIRFGSIESVEVSEELIELMATNPRVCPNLHLPLQAGSDPVLKSMNRHYNLQQYKDLVKYLRSRIPNLSITTDIIAGFPGETDELFEETMRTVKEVGFTHIHAFPYSIREGTPAAKMEDQVPEAVKKTRVALLNQLGKEGFKAYANRFLKQPVKVLIEPSDDFYYYGLTNEYVHSKIPKQDHAFNVGDIVGGTVTEVHSDVVLVEISI